MHKYIIDVWYRYVSYGEQEKDFETFNVKADNLIEAIKKANMQFLQRMNNPFKFVYKGIGFNLNETTKMQIFENTNPN